MAWDLSCPDWVERLKAGRSLMPSLPLRDRDAERAVKIFRLLRIPDVPGCPTFGEAAGDWFLEITAALHGSYNAATATRFLREIFLLVPKKNSKTTNGAGLMMTSLLVNERPRAEFLLIAPTLDVASLAFRQCLGMIELDEVLLARLYVQDHLRTITDRKTGATLRVKSFDPSVMTGVKPSGVLLDELHVMAADANADRVIGQARGGLISQPEGFLVFITTQSERPPAGVFKAELGKARAIRDGTLTGTMLPILYEFPPGVDWCDPANWHMVTPNHGRSITVDRLIPDYESARASGEEELRRWATQHLNVEVGLALRSSRWAGADYWEFRADLALTLDSLLERSELVTIGIDGGGLDDLLGLAVLGRDAETGGWLLWTHAYAAPDVLTRRKSEAALLRDLERAGDLTIVTRLPEDLTALMEIIGQVDATGLLAGVGMDQIGLDGIIDYLDDIGVEDERRIGISQGWKMSGAIKTTERRLADGTLTHSGQPLMSWAVGNAKVEPRGNAVMITKQASGTGKIDPLMATFDAVAVMSNAARRLEPSAYTADRGIRSF